MLSEIHQEATGKIGLVLSGGGARGAYQAGVLKAIAEIRDETSACRPLSILTGVSAGAINAAFLAGSPRPELDATDQLTRLWRSLESKQVFRTDPLSVGRIGLQWFTDATVGALYRRKMARSLLDTAPLRELLAQNINFDEIQKKIEANRLDAVSLTALNYANAHNLTWVQASKNIPMWERSRRKSVPVKLTVDHVLASSAIPLFFPPVQVGHDFYGDGCLRNTAPLSPAIHLGADRLIVISVRRPDYKAQPPFPGIEPSIARILGVMLNALMMDAIDFDMERLSRINSTLDSVPVHIRDELSLRKIDYLWIRPSQDIGSLASTEFKNLPNVIRYMIAGLGSPREASELTSYLLFDPDFCGLLVDLGYHDGRAQEEEIKKFLTA